MVTKIELIGQKNLALDIEIAAIVEYLYHSYYVTGLYRSIVAVQLKKNSRDEMEHMEYLSKRSLLMMVSQQLNPQIFSLLKFQQIC